jgi:DNA-binding MarR family transcriptional regulator
MEKPTKEILLFMGEKNATQENPISKNVIYKALGYGNSTVDAMIKTLNEEGLVETVKHGKGKSSDNFLTEKRKEIYEKLRGGRDG